MSKPFLFSSWCINKLVLYTLKVVIEYLLMCSIVEFILVDYFLGYCDVCGLHIFVIFWYCYIGFLVAVSVIRECCWLLSRYKFYLCLC